MYKNLNYSVDVTYGSELKAWGFNLHGICDSVAMIHMVIDGVIDTFDISNEFSNSARMYFTVE